MKVGNSLLPVQDVCIEDPMGRKSIGCGTAQQLLPRSPRTKIHGLVPELRYTDKLETLLASPPGGPEGVVLQAPGYGGDVIEGVH